MFLKGHVAPRTPYAIIANDGEVAECADYYTFHGDPGEHRKAFQRNLKHTLKRCPGTPVIGPVAELLYMALKGYKMHGSPDDADPQVALSARRAILNGCQLGHADALLAQQALVRWGPVVKPWWHTTKLDENYRVQWDAPEYHIEIPLPDLPPEWEAEEFYTTLSLDGLEDADGLEHMGERGHRECLAVAAPNHAAIRS